MQSPEGGDAHAEPGRVCPLLNVSLVRFLREQIQPTFVERFLGQKPHLTRWKGLQAQTHDLKAVAAPFFFQVQGLNRQFLGP